MGHLQRSQHALRLLAATHLDDQDTILVDALKRLEEATAAQPLLEREGAADVGQVVVVGLLGRCKLVAHRQAPGSVARVCQRAAGWQQTYPTILPRSLFLQPKV